MVIVVPSPPRLARRAAAVLPYAGLAVVLWLAPVELRGHGAFHDRMRELVAALDQTPHEARLHFELADVFCRHGDWQFALASADTADELSPGRYPTDLLRGEALLGASRPGKAKAALDRFVAAHPQHARALLLRARAVASTDGTSAALPDFRAAVAAREQREPDHAREAAAALAASGHADEAVQVLAAALAEFGPDPALLLAALELETATQRWPAALERIAALQAGAPRPEPWMVRRAQLLTQAGRHTEARTAWNAFLQHLDTLPTLERGATTFALFATQARTALASLPP
jgi:predicted Zn-dependent protease